MKSVGSFFILATLFLSAINGQNRITPTSVLFIHQGYVINNGLGFANSTVTTAANIAAANPATLADFGKTFLGISFLFASKIDSTLNGIRVNQERMNAWVPQAFGLVLPYQDFRLGLGFNQKYTSVLNVGEITVTDPGNPGGSEETVKPLFKTYVYSVSANAAYILPRFISPEHRLSLGLQIDVNFFRGYEEIGRVKGESSDQSITWKAGARYDFVDYLRFGLAYEKGASFEGTVKWNDEELITSTAGQQIIGQQIEQKFSGKMPDRLVLGLYFKVAEKLRLANDFTSVYWEKIANNLKNSLDISGNLVYQGWESVSLSGGFYSTRREYKDPEFEGDSGLFLSAAALVKLGRAEIEALIADSHLFSSDTRKQTLARLGLGYSF
jgi:hypothetical protein